MRPRSGIAAATAVILAGSTAALVGTLGARIVLARMLTPAEVGTLLLAFGLVTAVGCVASLGLNLSAGRRIAELGALGDRAGARRSASSAVLLAATAGAAGAVLVAALRNPIATLNGNPELAPILALLAPVVLAMAIGQSLIGVSRGFNDTIGRAAVRDAGGSLLRLAAIGAAAWLAPTAPGAAVALLCGSLAGEGAFLLSAVLRHWLGRVVRATFDRALFGEIGSYASITVLGQLSLWGDLLLLGTLAAPEVVGLYAVVKSLYRAAGMIPMSAAHSFLPTATAHLAAGEREAFVRLYRRARSLIFALLAPVVAVAVAAPDGAVTILFGQAYAPAGPALRWLGIALAVDVLLGFKDLSLIAHVGSRPVAAATGISTATGLAALLLLAPSGGAAGAAVAVLVMSIVRGGLLAVSAFRALAIVPWRHDASLGLPIAAGAVLAAVVLPIAGMGPFARVAIATLIGAVGSLGVLVADLLPRRGASHRA